MKEIKRRRFGGTGLEVTELAFGAMNLRRLDTVQEAYTILDYVLDQGVNLIDTARGYSGENKEGVLVESEVLVGNAIRNRADLEEPIVVVTKGHGYNHKALDEELGTSLKKLGIQGTGSLRIGTNDVKLVYLFHGINETRWGEMCASKVLEKAQALKAFGGNSMPAIFNTLSEYMTVDYPAMLRFCLSNPYISAVDADAKYPQEFRLDVETATGERLAYKERERLTVEAGKVAPHMKNICRECMHCLEKFECPNGVPFPEILSVYSRYLVNEKLERDTTRFRELFREQGFQANECIECGQCVPWCEYELNIPEMLKKAQQTLGQS